MANIEDTVEQIKERIDIVSLIGAQVALKKSGRSLKGLCPFHPEKTPSFYVFPDKENFHCFGCGANGDIFTYVMRTQNLSFGDALRLLAERAGVSLPERKPADAEEDKELERLRETCAAAAQFYQHQLRTAAGRVAAEYLARRGLTARTIDAFQLGYAPEGWDNLLKYMADRSYTPGDLVRAGLAMEREGGGHYDRFRNRVMFPIFDAKGRVIGFGARAMDDSQPKYLNSPETPLFQKGNNLYGIHVAARSIRERGEAVVVEGYFDVLVPYEYGITNVVASLGTALTERQVATLKRLTKKVVLALDADAAGEEATRRGLEVALQVFDRKVTPTPVGRRRVRYDESVDAEIRVLRLPEGKDPDEVVREDPQLWARLAEKAQPVVDFYFDMVSGRLDLSQPQDKSKAVEQLLPVIRDLGGDRVQQWHYVQRLATLVKVDERLLSSRLDQLARTGRFTRAPEAKPAQARPERTGPGLEEYYLGLLLTNLVDVPTESLLDPNDVGDARVRQVLEVIWRLRTREEGEEGPVDRGRVYEELDPLMREYCADLEQKMAALPPMEGIDRMAAYVEAALRVQEQSCRRTLREYRFLIQEAEERQDTEALADLALREHELHLRLDEIFKLKARRQ